MIVKGVDGSKLFKITCACFRLLVNRFNNKWTGHGHELTFVLGHSMKI
jgi:hypothetical protein